MCIGPDMRMALVGAPSFFARNTRATMPQELIKHKCINMRMPTYGGLYVWEFAESGRELSVRVDGQLIVNGIDQMLHALDGVGLAYALEDIVA